MVSKYFLRGSLKYYVSITGQCKDDTPRDGQCTWHFEQWGSHLHNHRWQPLQMHRRLTWRIEILVIFGFSQKFAFIQCKMVLLAVIYTSTPPPMTATSGAPTLKIGVQIFLAFLELFFSGASSYAFFYSE